MKHLRLPILLLLLIVSGFALHQWQLNRHRTPIQHETVFGDEHILDDIKISGDLYSTKTGFATPFAWHQKALNPFVDHELFGRTQQSDYLKSIPLTKRPSQRFAYLTSTDRYQIWYSMDRQSFNYYIYDQENQSAITQSVETKEVYHFVNTIALNGDRLDLFLGTYDHLNRSTTPPSTWVQIDLKQSTATINEFDSDYLPILDQIYAYDTQKQVLFKKHEDYVLFNPLTKEDTVIKMAGEIPKESLASASLDPKMRTSYFEVFYLGEMVYGINTDEEGIKTLYHYDLEKQTFKQLIDQIQYLQLVNQKIFFTHTDNTQFTLKVMDPSNQTIVYEGNFDLPSVEGDTYFSFSFNHY